MDECELLLIASKATFQAVGTLVHKVSFLMNGTGLTRDRTVLCHLPTPVLEGKLMKLVKVAEVFGTESLQVFSGSFLPSPKIECRTLPLIRPPIPRCSWPHWALLGAAIRQE